MTAFASSRSNPTRFQIPEIIAPSERSNGTRSPPCAAAHRSCQKSVSWRYSAGGSAAFFAGTFAAFRPALPGGAAAAENGGEGKEGGG